MKYQISLVACIAISISLCRAQSNVIDDFPLLSQHSSFEDYPNDCGEWAVTSILSYWNVNGYFPYTEFDRFLGEGIDPNVPANRELLAEMAVRLQHPLGYLYAGGNGSYGTDPYQMKQGIIEFCNSPEYGNDYNFVVNAYSNPSLLNNDYIWNKITIEIDNGRPVLFLVAGTIIARTDYTTWESVYMWHYMPVYGYNENFEGRKTLIAASLGNWNRIIYLDIESLSNTIGSFPDIWTINPQKNNSEPPAADLFVELGTTPQVEDIALYSLVKSASVIDHVEYEIDLYGDGWETAGEGTDISDLFEVIYNATGITYAEKAWFRSRALDYFGNYSEWSYADSFYTIDNSVPSVNTTDIPTAIPGLEENIQVSVYPNPVSDILNIIPGSGIYSGLAVSIYDVRGMPVYTKTIHKFQANEPFRIDISSLHTGLYFLVIRYSGSITVKKLIKHHY